MTITTEQLDELEHRSKDDNLAKMIVGSEVRELIAEVRRLTASLAEMRECYIARTEDRDRAEARVVELDAAVKYSESREADYRAEAGIWKAGYEHLKAETDADLLRQANKAEADRAVLVTALREVVLSLDDGGYGVAENCAREALAKVGEST